MKVWVLLLGCLMAEPAWACETLVECLDAVKTGAHSGLGISKKEQDIAKKVWKYQGRAIPGLLVLLKHEDPEIRNLAAYILRDIEGLEEKHLDDLITARRAGVGWISPAIAQVGSERAVRFVVDELAKANGIENQVGYAVILSGSKAVPYLMEYFYCDKNCDATLLRNIGVVLGRMKERSSSALDPLMKIISDKARQVRVRKAAIYALGEMEEVARSAIPLLTRIAGGQNPELRVAAENALIAIGAQEAVEIWIRRLALLPEPYVAGDNWLFINISKNGKNAHGAGSAVQKKIFSPDRDIRIMAIRTLGYIGYQEAIADLTEILANEQDWLVVYIAVESLGRLNAFSAIDDLEVVRDSHWYPPVREAAEKAIQTITDPESNSYPLESKENIPFRDFMIYQWAGDSIKQCSSVDYPIQQVDPQNKLYMKSDKETARQFSYGKEPSPPPTVGLKFKNGWLLGRDGGEWGGDLVFWKSSTDYYVLVRENIQDIFRTPYGIYAVAGLAHLGSNEGVILKVTENTEGGLTAKILAHLPGASYSNHLLEDGRLLLNTTRGSVLYSPERGLRMAECSKT